MIARVPPLIEAFNLICRILLFMWSLESLSAHHGFPNYPRLYYPPLGSPINEP